MSNNESFKIDVQEALKHIILRQAGSLKKAFMEAIQNSLDANAKEIRITTVPQINYRDDSAEIEEIRIVDDGEGLESLDDNFSIFAISQKDESQRGEFGIGRGQIFAKGSTLWRTKQYVISVDVMHNIENKQKIGFAYKEIEECFEGTDIQVDLYRPEVIRLKPIDLILITNKTKLYWNGELIDFKLKKKFSDSDYEMFHVRNGDIGGVFLKDIPVCNFSGIGLPNKLPFAINIISNKAKVNFARNEFMASDSDTDELLDKIKISLLTEVVKRVKNKKKTHDYEKELILKNILLLSEKELIEIEQTPFLRTTNGQSFSLFDLTGSVVAETTGSAKLDDVLVQKGFRMVDWSTLHALQRLDTRNDLDVIFYDDNESKSLAKENYNPEERTKNNPTTKRELELCLIAHIVMKYVKKHEWRSHNRQIFMGKGDANAWTDGDTYIVLNQRYLRYNKYQLLFMVPRVVVHEMCHRSLEDYHDDDFYLRFHNLLTLIMEDSKFTEEMNLFRDGTKKYLDRYGDKWGLTIKYEPER